MIEKLVEQVEERFAELQRQMSDPEVISDRERYAAVGREYHALEPASVLASRLSAAQRPAIENGTAKTRATSPPALIASQSQLNAPPL